MEADKYQDTLLIVTSDHGWREDPDWPHGKGQDLEGPLVIRWPEPTTPSDVDTPVRADALCADYRTRR